MWSAVCSVSPHSHAALSTRPQFSMDALYRPTPVLNLFRVVQCFRLKCSALTHSPGSDTWRCTQVGTDASHSCFHIATCIILPVLGGWHLASPESPCSKVYGTWVRMEALHYLWCRAGCASRVSLLSVPKTRVAAFSLRPAGAIPAKTASWNTGVGLRQRDMVRIELSLLCYWDGRRPKLSCLY